VIRLVKDPPDVVVAAGSSSEERVGAIPKPEELDPVLRRCTEFVLVITLSGLVLVLVFEALVFFCVVVVKMQEHAEETLALDFPGHTSLIYG